MPGDDLPKSKTEEERMFEDGCAYFFGEGGVQKDPGKAVACFQKAAAAGMPLAAQNLAICYYDGIGTDQSKEAAAHWFNVAALHGLSDGQRMFGLMLYNGDGVRQNRKEGLVWLEKAANKNCSAALTDLGYLYGDRKNEEYDAKTSAKYFMRGAECGDRSAHAGLSDLYARLSAGGQDRDAHIMIDLYYRHVYGRNNAVEVERALVPE